MKPADNCPSCAILVQRLEEARRDPHKQYDPIIQLLMGMEANGTIELFAGDCPLKDTDEVLCAERHYTVCHYLRCRTCGAIYFVGACIRGTPVYRRVDDLQKENVSFRLWGRCGRYFANE